MKILIVLFLLVSFFSCQTRSICCQNCRSDSVLELYDVEVLAEGDIDDECERDEVCMYRCSNSFKGCRAKRFLLVEKDSSLFTQAFSKVCLFKQRLDDTQEVTNDPLWEKVNNRLSFKFPDIYQKVIVAKNITNYSEAEKFLDLRNSDNRMISTLVSFVRIMRSFKKICYNNPEIRYFPLNLPLEMK